jgi:hypothetical protein
MMNLAIINFTAFFVLLQSDFDDIKDTYSSLTCVTSFVVFILYYQFKQRFANMTLI